MKKLACMVLVVTLFLAMTGYGGAEGGNEVTLTYWGQDYNQNVLDSCFDKFTATYPNITVERETLPLDEILRKCILAFSSGTGAPDVATVATYNMGQFISTGCLVDITDRLAPYVDQLDQASLINDIKDGRIYGIPLDIGPCGLFVNIKIFEDAGYDTTPEALSETLSTWEKYVQVAKDIKEKTGCYMLGYSSEMPDPQFFEVLIWQQNRWFSDPEGNLTLNSPESIRAFELIDTLIKEELNYNVQGWTQEWYSGFNDYKVATIPTAAWMGGFMNAFICPDTAGDWRVIPLPAWEEGGVRTSNAGGSAWIMTNQVADEDAAWALMSFYTLDVDNVLAQYEAMDQFPALLSSYGGSFFDEPMDFFGGQAVRRVFADLVPDIPSSVVYSKDYSMYSETIVAALQSVILSGVDITQALANAEQEIDMRR